MRLLAAILLVVGAGIALAEDEPDAVPGAAIRAMMGAVPLPRQRPPMWAEPHTFREAAGPDFKSDDVTDEPSDCRKRLDLVAANSPMPRLIGPGACGGGDMVELDAVLMTGRDRIVVKPAPVLRCAMAERLAIWIRDEAAPRVAAQGPALQRVDTYDDFDCRGRNRVVGAKLSEHGKGNAVDLRSFTTVDGHVMELTDIRTPKEFRASMRETACARFTTVLGPGSDGYHEAHIHLDLAERRGNYSICQWDVREPPTVLVASVQIDGKRVPLPPPRPTSAAAAFKDDPKL